MSEHEPGQGTALTINIDELLASRNCKPGVWYHVKIIGYSELTGGSFTIVTPGRNQYIRRHPRSAKRANIYKRRSNRNV